MTRGQARVGKQQEGSREAQGWHYLPGSWVPDRPQIPLT